MWTKFHVGNQSRHGHSEPYTTWALSYQDFDAIVNPPTPQGIIELHNKSLKHVCLNDRIDRIDRIDQQLDVAKVLLHRQYWIIVCFHWSNRTKF